MLLVLGQEGNERRDLFCFANEVREAGLAVCGLNEVIGGVIIGHQAAAKARAEDSQGRRLRRIDLTRGLLPYCL